MVRYSMKFVPWKDYKAVAADLKRVYQSVTEEEALQELDEMEVKWASQYPQISRSWRDYPINCVNPVIHIILEELMNHGVNYEK